MADHDVKDRKATTSEPTHENPSGPIGTEVVFENDQVRVWDMRVAPGGKKAWHHHTMDYVIINISGGKIELEDVNGHSFIADDKVGGVIWNDAGQKHELRNLSGKPYQNILVELKNGKKSLK
jgi:quercetin dioxygenase-like cupin family protein